MDVEVIVAIIGAVGVISAAAIPAYLTYRRAHADNDPGTESAKALEDAYIALQAWADVRPGQETEPEPPAEAVSRIRMAGAEAAMRHVEELAYLRSLTTAQQREGSWARRYNTAWEGLCDAARQTKAQ